MCCSNSTITGNFTYVAYASDKLGSNFNLNKNASGVTRNYMAVYVSDVQLDPADPVFPNYFYNRWYWIGDINLANVIPFGKYQIWKAKDNLVNLHLVEEGDRLAGFWAGEDYDNGDGIAITNGMFVVIKYGGTGSLDDLANFNIVSYE